MFWIGFASGSGVACLIAVASIAALGWAASKERAQAVNKNGKDWRDSLEIQIRNAETFERIERLIDLKRR